MLLHVTAADHRVVVELPSRRMERVRERDVHILVPRVAGRLARDRDLVPLHVHADANVKHVAVPVVVMRLLDHDGTTEDPAVRALETIDPTLDRLFD